MGRLRELSVNSSEQSSGGKETIQKQSAWSMSRWLAMLEWASDHPTKWHKIVYLDATKKAADSWRLAA